jgi:hypothetical protein
MEVLHWLVTILHASGDNILLGHPRLRALRESDESADPTVAEKMEIFVRRWATAASHLSVDKPTEVHFLRSYRADRGSSTALLNNSRDRSEGG